MNTVSQLRAAVGLSQSEFGARLGISQPTVSDIEAGKLRLTARVAIRALDVWPEEVKAMGGVETLLRGAQ